MLSWGRMGSFIHTGSKRTRVQSNNPKKSYDALGQIDDASAIKPVTLLDLMKLK